MRMKLCGAVADQVIIAPPPLPAVFMPLYYPLFYYVWSTIALDLSGWLDMNFAV